MEDSSPSTVPVPQEISKQDYMNTVHVCNELLKVSAKYHRKVLELSQVTTEFATALDAISKCKAADKSGIGMRAAAELHRSIAKQQEQLAEMIQKDFEVPLQRNLTTHQKRLDENEKSFEKNMRKMQDEISKTENRMLKGRKKDLTAFQQSLQDMQRQAQEMEQIKTQHNEKVLADEHKNFMFLVQKAAGLVKNEYDHFSQLTNLSRDVTEDIITIAFTPAGSHLDAAEKRRVVDKFLGSGSGTRPDTFVPVSGTLSNASDFGARRPTGTSTTSITSISKPRPATPPHSPKTESPLAGGLAAVPIAKPNLFPRPQQAASADEGLSSSQKSKELDAALERLNKAANKLALDDESEEPASNAVAAPAPGLAAKPKEDLVAAIHDFTGRSERELSFKKNDVMVVKQRQDSWLYASHYRQPGGKSGWIPVSYTKPYQA